MRTPGCQMRHPTEAFDFDRNQLTVRRFAIAQLTAGVTAPAF